MVVDSRQPQETAAGHRVLLFEVAGQQYALDAHQVEQITAMADLQQSPGMPALLQGFLNLAGDLVPVVCVRHLFNQPKKAFDLWTPLIVVQGSDGHRIALLVDRVQSFFAVPDGGVRPLPSGHSLNNCAQGTISSADHSALLLSLDRLLLEREKQSMVELQELAQGRLAKLEGAAT